MGSREEKQVVGQFMHPVIDPDTKNDDPWQRNYFQPLQLKKLVPRSFPLVDIRPSISDPKYQPAELLKSHGFGILKHSSALLAPPYVQEDLSDQTIAEVYHPEIQDLVTKTTGAKHVFVTATVIRHGKQAPEEYKIPTGARPVVENNGTSQSKEGETKLAGGTGDDKPLAQVIFRAVPVRIPHMDYTPLGARQTIRFEKQEIYDTAIESGVIAAEDKICEDHPFRAPSKEVDPLIAEQYNQNGKLGPRYAAYSVWRPLKTVGRDPLAVAPWKNSGTHGDLVYWPYENKIPGSEELGGDFLKEYAMLGIQGDSPASSSLQWYYLSKQQPEEVWLVKFFDSAALGEDSREAGAPFHASPEIGAVEGDSPRESIELRVLAFW